MKYMLSFSLILIAVGLAMWVGYGIQGSHIDSDGVLQEPFHLLALGWLANIAGLLLSLIYLAIYLWKRIKG